MKLTFSGLAIAAAPPAVMLALFYSLAFHMHQVLGGWPTAIGEQGFSPKLVLHSHVDRYLFTTLFCSFIFVLPMAVVLCGAVARWRWILTYFGLYLAFGAVAAGLMELAPAQFLNWWWD